MTTASQSYRRKDFDPVWCPGCGYYGVLHSVEEALGIIGILPEQTVVVSGIGCSGRLSHYLNTYSLHGTHGRALPIATGVKTARPDLTTIVVGGEGDVLGIGGGHLPHAARKNVDLTLLLLDNNTYGMTKGQSSPTTPWGCVTKTSPYGSAEDALDVLPILIAYDVSFVARTASTRREEMAGIIAEAIKHPGFSVVHILSPCVTFPVVGWKDVRDKLHDLPMDHNPRDKRAAMEIAYTNSTIYTGVVYCIEKPILSSRLEHLNESALKHYSAGFSGGRKPSITRLMERYM
ncbi:MAG: 2-oxoacid:ferredoxin oxidoreductase subunit beta [Spirochaetota bacterium]|nr:MAG: 2-oxoacid:ferredoxin oxidoreductase subunit beta [Spirochaetota bacterium]